MSDEGCEVLCRIRSDKKHGQSLVKRRRERGNRKRCRC